MEQHKQPNQAKPAKSQKPKRTGPIQADKDLIAEIRQKRNKVLDLPVITK